MYVACSTLCFARLPIDGALRLMSELGFGKVDVAIAENSPHLKPSEVVNDITEVSVTPKKTDIYVQFFGIAWMPFYQLQTSGESFGIQFPS